MRKSAGANKSEDKQKEEPTPEATETIKEYSDEVPPNGPVATEEGVQEVEEEPDTIKTAPIEPKSVVLGEIDPKMRVSPAKKMFRIILQEQENSDKNQDQLVTDPSNGKQYLIKRGFEVDVPEGVLNNLKESITERLEYDDNGNEVWRKIPRFSFTVVKEL
jgi:hypothetical protein